MIAPHNIILQGHALDKLRELPDDCIDLVVTSTPYYGLRDYGPECVTVWNGKNDCNHQWKAFNWKLHNGSGGAQKSAKFSEQEDIPDMDVQYGCCDKCGAWKGQLGLEPHPSMFIEHLAQVFLEVKRVLKPTGSLWLNLGDTYFGGNGKNGRPENWQDLESKSNKIGAHAPAEFIRERNKLRSNWLQPKQKMLIPARVAIALQDQGWILRNEIVWHKVNHMPESCQDRLTRSWESVFFFVKTDRYYFNLNAIRKPYPQTTIGRCKRKYLTDGKVVNGNLRSETQQKWAEKVIQYAVQPREKDFVENRNLPSLEQIKEYLSYWRKQRNLTIEQIEDALQSQAPHHWFNGESYPTVDDWKRIKSLLVFDEVFDKQMLEVTLKPAEKQNNPLGPNPGDVWDLTTEGLKEEHFAAFPQKLVKHIIQCAMPKEGILLDPFAGAGTALLVAHKMGYDWIGIELVPKYCDIINKRIERHGRIRLDKFVTPCVTSLG